MFELIESLGRVPHVGEILSVFSAFLWSASIVIMRVVGRRAEALAVNMFKNVVGFVLLLPTLAVFGVPLLPGLPAGLYALFLASGFLGIAVADTLLLAALNKLGAELTAIVDCGYSVFAIGMSFLYLGERMSTLQLGGAALIVSALLLISGRKTDVKIPPRDLAVGIAMGTAAVFLMALGIVMVKPQLGRVPVLWASTIRMAGGTAGVLLAVAVHPRRRELLSQVRPGRSWRLLVPASILATYLSTTLWLAGMSLTQASVAAALNQLSTVFIFVLGAVFLKERVTPRKLLAVVLAFSGAVIVALL